MSTEIHASGPWLPPHEEASAEQRLLEIIQETALGRTCTARDAYWAASLARDLIAARKGTRAALDRIMHLAHEQEQKIAILQSRLQTEPKPIIP
jgi:hypothetical protein